MSSDDNVVSDLIRELYSLQEQRVYIYQLFEEGHKIYLNSSPNYDFLKFRHLVHDLTAEFKRISDSVIAIEEKLRYKHLNAVVADLIYNLQEEEKEKLKLTAKLQLAKQELIESNDDQKWEEVNAIKKQLTAVIENINGHLRDIRYETDE